MHVSILYTSIITSYTSVLTHISPYSDPVTRSCYVHLTSEELESQRNGVVLDGSAGQEGQKWDGSPDQSDLKGHACNLPAPVSVWSVSWEPGLRLLPPGRLPGFSPRTQHHHSASWFVHLASCEVSQQSQILPDLPHLLPSSHWRGLFEPTEGLPCPLHPGPSPHFEVWNLTSSSFGIWSLLVSDLVVGYSPLV